MLPQQRNKPKEHVQFVTSRLQVKTNRLLFLCQEIKEDLHIHRWQMRF